MPPPVRGIGTGGGFKMMIEDRRGRGVAALDAVTQEMVAAANQQPGLANVFSVFNTRTPKIYANIDLVRAEMLGVTPERVFETLEVYLGSTYVNDFNYLGRIFQVRMQADGAFRQTLRDVGELKTRSVEGGMVPLSSVASFEDRTGPYRVPRYNLYPAAEVQGATLPGTSTGEALERMEDLAARILPAGFGYEWTELALQERQAGNTGLLVFVAAAICVFLVLAAQYESWTLPLAVILIVPMCLLAAVSGLLLRGIDVNILAQIGFVVLIGLAAKNAILIVEFARQRERAGLDRFEAAVEAARIRMRPILMTSFAFIFGVVPLALATGAGAEMRQALGTAVFFGMLGVTALRPDLHAGVLRDHAPARAPLGLSPPFRLCSGPGFLEVGDRPGADPDGRHRRAAVRRLDQVLGGLLPGRKILPLGDHDGFLGEHIVRRMLLVAQSDRMDQLVHEETHAHARSHFAGLRILRVNAGRCRHADRDRVEIVDAVDDLRLRRGAAVQAVARLGLENDVRAHAFLDLAERELQAMERHLPVELGDRLVEHRRPLPAHCLDRVGQRVLPLDVLVPRSNGHGLTAP